ncbi:MAG: acyltransferase [Myxococcales bacterium]|nr:MAG: acyltransferase [Myxococcales bacterium]
MPPAPRVPSSPLAQIRRRAGTLSVREALVVTLDEWLGALLRPIPSLLGAVLRWGYFRLTFARLDGFCFIRPGARISYSCGMSVGRNLHLNGGTFIDARGGLTLGNDVLIGPNAVLLTSQHHWRDPSRPIVVQGHEMAPTRIGDDVWIGANAVVLPGVHIATGTVVGAGAVVTEDTQPYSIVAGVPARLVGTRPPPPGAPAAPSG